MLSVEDVTVSFAGRTVLDGIELSVDTGETAVCVGRSGCGKTTLLRTVAGILEPDAGSLRCEGRTAMVFQDAHLLPWRTVLDNLLLLGDIGDRAVTRDRAEDLLRMFGLPDAADRYPHQLSGGMRQRVAFARALAADPDILLVDEPFSSLDYLMKDRLRGDVMDVLADAEMTTLLVTHDLETAVEMGDSVHVLSDGPARVVDRFDGTDGSLDDIADALRDSYDADLSS